MESDYDFKGKNASGEDIAAFGIEVSDGQKNRYFWVKPLDEGRFEILDDDETIGTLQLDESDHLHCESQGCELDLPLLHAIRTEIQSRKQADKS